MAEDDTGRRKGRRFLPWLLALAVLGIGAALAFAAVILPGGEEETQKAPPGPLVEIATATRTDLPVTVTQTGLLRAGAELVLAPQVGGRVATIGDGFSTGARMAEGDLVVALDRDPFEADVASAQAALAGAEAASQAAQSDLARQRELEGENVVAASVAEDAASAARQAQAQVAQAAAQLRTAEIALEESRVTAPFDALVLQTDAVKGRLVSAGTSLGTLALAGYAEVAVGLSETDFALLGGAEGLIGAPVALTPERLNGGEVAPRLGTVTAVSPRIESAARTTEVIVSIADPFAPGPDGGTPLRVGEVVRAAFALPQASAPFVAPPGVVQRGETLWAVSEEDRLIPLDATLERRMDDFVLLSGELEGVQLLLTPVDTPVEGLKVRVTEGDPVTVDRPEDTAARRLADVAVPDVAVPGEVAGGGAATAQDDGAAAGGSFSVQGGGAGGSGAAGGGAAGAGASAAPQSGSAAQTGGTASGGSAGGGSAGSGPSSGLGAAGDLGVDGSAGPPSLPSPVQGIGQGGGSAGGPSGGAAEGAGGAAAGGGAAGGGSRGGSGDGSGSGASAGGPGGAQQ